MSNKKLWLEYCEEMRLFEVQDIINEIPADLSVPNILKAGCGSATHFQLRPNSKLVGIDISQEQLDRNSTLSRKILGDVQTYDLSGENYDAIICYFVLEHLDAPEKALKNFFRGLSNNGILIIVAPNLFSLSVLIAKFTPFWFHKFIYRTLLRGGHSTSRFPTKLRVSMTPRRVKMLAELCGLKVRYLRIYEGWNSWKLSRESRFMRAIYRISQILGKMLTFGKWDMLLSTYAIVVSKEVGMPFHKSCAYVKKKQPLM